MIIECTECDKKIKLPPEYSSLTGRCPQCKSTINLLVLIFEEIFTDAWDHPVKALLRQNTVRFFEYSATLQKLYKRMRARKIRKDEFDLNRNILKTEYFDAFINGIVQIPDFTFFYFDRILLWDYVFQIFPYTAPEVDSDVVLNVYQRYDLAAIIGLSYILKPYPDREFEKDMIFTALERTEKRKHIKELMDQVFSSGYSDKVSNRAKQLLEDHAKLQISQNLDFYRKLKFVYEDFGYGFNWIKLNLK